MAKTENPYQTPQSDLGPPPPRPPRLISWVEGISIVLGATAACGLGGLGIGAALGTWVPNYYRSVFNASRRPDFDPVAVGIGQGLTQGIDAGLVLGLLLVAAIAWFRLRRAALMRR
jgi:hypothetical protein